MKSLDEIRKENGQKFIEKCKIKYGDKFDYSKTIYINNYTNIIIICKKHGEFLQQPNNHYNYGNCPRCLVEASKSSVRLTNEEFIKRITNILGDSKYDFSKVNYVNNHTNVDIICNIHDLFKKRPGDILNKKQGCPECGKLEGYNKRKYDTDIFIKKAIKKHGDKYDYSETIYNGCFKKVKIICKLHGVFEQVANIHLLGKGCAICGIIEGARKSILKCPRKGVPKPGFNTEKFIIRAIKKHGHKFDYSKVIYVNAQIKVEIICPIHGSFWQTPNSHLNGSGCPHCVHQISKPEIVFLDYFNVVNRHVHIKPYLVDGYDPETKTIYEFLGNYWHGNPKLFNPNELNKRSKKTYGELYNNTFKKFDILKQMGYNIKYIWEQDWDNFTNEIDKEPKIITHSFLHINSSSNQ